MAIDGTLLCNDVCEDALRKIGVISQEDEATADEIETARRALNRLLKSWQNDGFNLWCVTRETVTATTIAAHSLTAGRPIEIQNIRLKRNGIETPMCRMGRLEYDQLPQKDSTGLPTQFYFDRQRDTGDFLVWPLLTAANGETFEVTYVREIEDVILTDPVDVPSEYYEALVYGLADRLADDFMVNAPRVTVRAEREYELARSAEAEGSVYFVGENYA